jgi:predicted metal-dependent phosphoesterase TrpH
MVQLFRYETHTHTAEVSRCSRISAVELVRVYKDLGFSGVCITDHFLNGNTTVPHNLPWDERIELFCRGYRLAYAEGKRIGIDVFFGWEYSYRGTDLLTYGLDPEWLHAHPEIMDLTMNQYCDLVREHGGFIAQAHPFREDFYIDLIRLLPRKVDAVEVINICRSDFENTLADQYADNYNLLKIAGSDNHVGYLDRFAGLELPRRAADIHDLIEAVKTGDAKIFVC